MLALLLSSQAWLSRGFSVSSSKGQPVFDNSRFNFSPHVPTIHPLFFYLPLLHIEEDPISFDASS
jgi:hypothetical protein